MSRSQDLYIKYIKYKNINRELLKKMLLDHDYQFPNYDFEPSSSQRIKKDELSVTNLIAYLKQVYGTCDKPKIHDDKIKMIVGSSRADYLIQADKSEYFKVLTHFTILSKVKQGWFNLFVERPTTSLSDNPLSGSSKKSKQLHDAIIYCYYSRLIEGMSEQDKERYQVLLPEDIILTKFDLLINNLDESIQHFFELAYNNIENFGNEETLENQTTPLSLINDSLEATNLLVHHFFNSPEKEGYKTDTLRANLIKFASINRAINEVNAILNIQQDDINTVNLLPDNIEQLRYIDKESQIVPAIANLFNTEEDQLPTDLIHCAKLVCKMHIATSTPYQGTEESFVDHSKTHLHPSNIAISSALLYQSFLNNEEINLGIRGETNSKIEIYKTLSDFSNKIKSTDSFTLNQLTKQHFPETLFKHLTTRYSISMFIKSDTIPFRDSTKNRLDIKIRKFKIQRKAYELLKDMSVQDAHQQIAYLNKFVNYNIRTQT